MRLTENFELSEFASKDGAEFPGLVIENLRRLANNLQVLRDHLNARITVNSGYRSPAHNTKIKGAKDSQHMKGTAADIVVDGYAPNQVFDAIEDLQNKGLMEIGGLHAYNSFCHIDIRGVKARW